MFMVIVTFSIELCEKSISFLIHPDIFPLAFVHFPGLNFLNLFFPFNYSEV